MAAPSTRWDGLGQLQGEFRAMLRDDVMGFLTMPQSAYRKPKAVPNRRLEAARRALASPSGAPGMCMSRRELAEAANAYVWEHTRRHTNMTEHDIGRLERGEVRWPDQWRRYGLRGVLGAGQDVDLGLYSNRRTHRSQRIGGASDGPGSVASDEPAAAAAGHDLPFLIADRETGQDLPAVLDGPVDPRQAESMRRSAFLRAAGAGLASVLVPPLVHSWPDAIQHHEIDEAELVRLRAITEGLRWLDRREGAADLLAHTADHARAATATWRSSAENPRLRTRLAEVAADACHLVAYQAFDQGKRTAAVEWYRCSAELAAQTGNRDLYVFAMCGVAYMYARNGQPLSSMSVLRQLSELLLSPTAKYYLAVYEAHTHAAAADEKAALHALDSAQFLAEREGAPGTSAPWLGVPDPVFVERQRGMILADLGSVSGEAVLSWLDQNTPISFRRYRVTLLTSQALLCARHGEPEEAADLLGQAVGRNAHIRSRERLARMVHVRTALAPFEGVPGLADIDHLLRTQAQSDRAVQVPV